MAHAWGCFGLGLRWRSEPYRGTDNGGGVGLELQVQSLIVVHIPRQQREHGHNDEHGR